MDLSGVREIRRRFNADLSNLKNIYGCYVNVAGQVVARMEIPILDMTAEEKEIYARLLKRAMSGRPDKNLLDIQMKESPNQKSLYALAASKLEDSAMRNALYDQIIENLEFDKNYCILLAADTYDVKSRDKDKNWSEDSETEFAYFVCGICPIRETRAELRYTPDKEEFRSNSTGNVLASPVLGFSYPAFVERGADIYSAVYYFNKDSHEELIEALFSADAPKTAAEKKDDFHNTLAETLDEDYSLETTALLQSRFAELHDTEDVVTAWDIKETLKGVVSEEKLEEMSEALGDGYECSLDTLTEKKFQIETTETKIITEDPAGLKVKEIDGRTYILVPTSGVKVNGKEVHI